MIQSKQDLKAFLKADAVALGRKGSTPPMLDFIWRYEILLRKEEYYVNCNRGLFMIIMKKYTRFKRVLLGVLCGFEIPINVFGKGLSIAHKGTIIVNSHAKVGDNCRLHACTNIGTRPGVPDAAPIIGNNVYIGPGAKIYGKIQIADDIIIGANSVVNKSILQPSVCVAGVPARIIKEMGRNQVEAEAKNISPS